MRVTKTVREYIEREISTRIYRKYEAEKAEAEYQREVLNKACEAINAELAELAKTLIERVVNENEFLEADLTTRNMPCLGYRTIDIKDRIYSSNVHNWEGRARTEVRKATDEIIVELELGGTKADLMAMLERI